MVKSYRQAVIIGAILLWMPTERWTKVTERVIICRKNICEINKVIVSRVYNTQWKFHCSLRAADLLSSCHVRYWLVRATMASKYWQIRLFAIRLRQRSERRESKSKAAPVGWLRGGRRRRCAPQSPILSLRRALLFRKKCVSEPRLSSRDSPAMHFAIDANAYVSAGVLYPFDDMARIACGRR